GESARARFGESAAPRVGGQRRQRARRDERQQQDARLRAAGCRPAGPAPGYAPGDGEGRDRHHRRERRGHPCGVVSMGFAASTDVPWTIPPDWADGMQESLSWLTDITQATATGVTQHRALRSVPRRAFAFSV